MNKRLSIDKVVKSVSITHRFDKPQLKFLNTSDVENGKIIKINILPIAELKGQAKKTIKKDDILFSEIRPKNRRFAYIDFDDTDDFVVSTKLMVLRNINPDVDHKYFYYYLTNEHMLSVLQDRAENRIGSFPQITFDLLSEYSIRVPHISEQKKIALLLSNIDSKIENNNKINAELEAMAKTIYDYWFVQFDFPNAKGKPYKNSGGKMVWNQELKREIPDGWETSLMKEWLTLNKSGDWGKEIAEGNYNTKVTCIRGTDINGINGLENCNPPERYILEKNAFKILESHDLIVEISGGSPTQSTGRLAFVTGATMERFENPLICSNFCKPISLKNKKLLYNFVYYWESLYKNGTFFSYEGKTSGIKNLLFDSFVSSYYTLVPPDALVNKFYDFMTDIQNKKQTALKENAQLASLRDWLLPMLMNGQVKVRDVGNAKDYDNRPEEVKMAAEGEVIYTNKIKNKMA